MNDGWRKQWRKTWDNPLLRGRKNHLIIWFWLLDHVVWKETRVRCGGKVIILKPGQICVNVRQIAKYFVDPTISYSTVFRVLNDMRNTKLHEGETLIETKSTPRYTIITIKNWAKYQSDETTGETNLKQSRNKPETKYQEKPLKLALRIPPKKGRREEGKKRTLAASAAKDSSKKSIPSSSVPNSFSDHMRPAAIFAVYSETAFTSAAEVRDYCSRYARASTALSIYDTPTLCRAVLLAEQGMRESSFGYHLTLETVRKYIDDARGSDVPKEILIRSLTLASYFEKRKSSVLSPRVS
ncbi:MAG: hypothetical protein QQN63_03130 [Nitrosopumilus sp.]